MNKKMSIYVELIADSMRRIGDILIALSLAHFIFR